MKNNNMNNLFVRGGKTAVMAMALASILACSKENNPYGNVNNTGLVGLAMVIGILALPAIIDKIKSNRQDKQK